MPVVIFVSLMLALLVFIVWERRRPVAPLSRSVMARGYAPPGGAKWVAYLCAAVMTGFLGFNEWLTPKHPPFTGRGATIMKITYECFGSQGIAILWWVATTAFLILMIFSFRVRNSPRTWRWQPTCRKREAALVTDFARADFKLPAAVINRQFRTIAALLAGGTVISHLLINRGGIASVLSTALVFSVLLVVLYYIAKRHIWVSLSPSGITGMGFTGRRISIPWSEPTTVTPGIKSGVKGVQIRASKDDGILRSEVFSLFVPEPILASQSFQGAVRQLAPSGHPLRVHAAPVAA